MKTKKTLGMALALASALFLAACSNMDSGSVDNGAAYLYSTTRTLTVNVDSVELSDGSGEGVYDPWINRTVLPGTAYTTDDLTLVLRAISDGKKETFTYLTGGSTVSGGTQYVVPLTAASYDFWLYAYVTSAIPAAHATDDAKTLYQASDVINPSPQVTTALWAHAAQDLTNGNNTTPLEFKLSPVDLKGNGIVELGGKCSDPDNSVTSVRVGVYNIFTNEEIKGADVTPTASGTDKLFATTTWNDVPAGSYRAAVTFLDNGNEVGYWSDFIIVEPSNTSGKTDIEFSGIKTIPKAPTGLTASLKEGSFGAGKETYDVVLDWNDNADNEKGFLVRVSTYTVNFATPGETATEEVFGFASGTIRRKGTATVTATALIDSGYFTQTATPTTNLLLSQCTSVTLTLKTGYLYDFEVVAYNAIGCSQYSDTDAVADGYTDAAESGSTAHEDFTPRKVVDTAVITYTSGKMAYMKKKAPDAAVGPTWGAASGTDPDKDVDYYDKTNHKIQYISSYGAGGAADYEVITAGGTPYTPYHVNLYYIRYDLEGGLYYGTGVSKGSQYAFFRFGNDKATFNTNFGAVDPAVNPWKGSEPLQNPITTTGAAAPTPTSANSNTTPFVLKWNSSNTAFSNWVVWYRQSSTVNGNTYSYKPAAGAKPTPADPLELTVNNAAFGNQVVYAGYAGATSDLTIVVSVNSASSGANEIVDSAIVATVDGTSAPTIDINPDATSTVDIDTNPNLTLQLKPSPVAYTAVRYEISGVVQSATVDSSTGVCTIPLADWKDKGTIRVLLAGFKDGAWYSRAFNIKLTGSSS